MTDYFGPWPGFATAGERFGAVLVLQQEDTADALLAANLFRRADA
jgi:hypothetical protein